MADHHHIDIYCERLGPEFWAEPVNAVTNAAFLVAALFAFLSARRDPNSDIGVYALVVLIAAIGIGSFLFHTYAVTWAKYADVIPIMLFKLGFLWIYSRSKIGWSTVQTGGLIIVFVLLNLLSGFIPYHWFNGSQGYAAALIFLIGFAVHQYRNETGPQRFLLAGAAGVFCLSLTFRSLDMALCDMIPLGVHFLWHILNAVVLYLCVRSLIKPKTA